MARVTVEDCVEVISNRFDLVVVSAQRAKQIASGAPLTLDRDNDKDAVVALREVAEETVNFDDLRDEVVSSFSSYQMSEAVHSDQEESSSDDVSETYQDAQAASAAQEQEASEHMSFLGMDEEIND